MTFYYTKPSWRKEIIGNTEVYLKYPNDYDRRSPNSISRLYRYLFNDPPVIPQIEYLILNKGAILNDFMDSPGGDTGVVLISEKVKELFQKYNIQKFILFSLKIKDQTSKYFNYYWVHLTEDLRKYIDYKASEFRIKSAGQWKDKININSYEELIEKQDQISKIDITALVKANRLSFNSDNIWKYDFFKASDFDLPFFYISSNLKDEIEKYKLTGLDYWDLTGQPLF